MIVAAQTLKMTSIRRTLVRTTKVPQTAPEHRQASAGCQHRSEGTICRRPRRELSFVHEDCREWTLESRSGVLRGGS
ncbi:hypothetical protein V5799_028407 [Amblyomma americanum]|uniref:Uncharacterized protein n=1 Tax=Amblyomma americanum TaxID=6943 RepID=A0AAQ4DCY6_AMBAM